MLKKSLNSLLDYIQPTKYIVSSEEYSNVFNTPVLTAGDTFLLGYTNDKDGIYEASKRKPIILFDDFTTAIKWVDFPFKVKSSACKIIIPKETTNLRYCFYAMKAMNFDHTQHKRYWISEYSAQIINDYGEDNSKIVAELDNIADAISNKERMILNMNELIKSRFIEMFSTCDKIVKLSEISNLITKGASPKWQGINYVDEGTLFVTSENVREGFIDLSNPKYLENKINEKQPRSVLKNGDILINIVGASIGRAALYELNALANINQAVSLVRTNNDINKKYLITYLNSDGALEQYRENAKGGARDNLSLKNISDLKIPLPTLTKQNEFAEFVKQIDKSKFIVQQEIKDLQELLDKKMDEYFG